MKGMCVVWRHRGYPPPFNWLAPISGVNYTSSSCPGNQLVTAFICQFSSNLSAGAVLFDIHTLDVFEMQTRCAWRGDELPIVWFFLQVGHAANWSLLIARWAFWVAKCNSQGRLLIVKTNICRRENDFILPILTFWPLSV